MGLGFNPRKLDGGKIKGPGAGTSDSIDALAEEGSFIMPADSTKKLGLDDEGLGYSPEMAGRQAPQPGLGFGGSDVPIRVSNGEFAFTPEEIYQIGLAVLRGQLDATHAPVPEKQGFGFHPQAFANGNLVYDKEQDRMVPYAGSSVERLAQEKKAASQAASQADRGYRQSLIDASSKFRVGEIRGADLREATQQAITNRFGEQQKLDPAKVPPAGGFAAAQTTTSSPAPAPRPVTSSLTPANTPSATQTPPTQPQAPSATPATGNREDGSGLLEAYQRQGLNEREALQTGAFGYTPEKEGAAEAAQADYDRQARYLAKLEADNPPPMRYAEERPYDPNKREWLDFKQSAAASNAIAYAGEPRGAAYANEARTLQDQIGQERGRGMADMRMRNDMQTEGQRLGYMRKNQREQNDIANGSLAQQKYLANQQNAIGQKRLAMEEGLGYGRQALEEQRLGFDQSRALPEMKRMNLLSGLHEQLAKATDPEAREEIAGRIAILSGKPDHYAAVTDAMGNPIIYNTRIGK